MLHKLTERKAQNKILKHDRRIFTEDIEGNEEKQNGYSSQFGYRPLYRGTPSLSSVKKFFCGDGVVYSWSAVMMGSPMEQPINSASNPARSGEQHIRPT